MEYAEGLREIDTEGWAIVTGWGRGSGESGPVLPAACRDFLGELDPPLEVVEGDNPGMLTVPAASIEGWVRKNKVEPTTDWLALLKRTKRREERGMGVLQVR